MKFVGVLLFFLFFQGAFASDQCSSTLKASSFYQTEVQTETIPQFELSERFIAYIKSLHQAGALSLDKLILLREELKANSNVYSLLSSDSNNPELVLTAHLPMLAEYLERASLDTKFVAKGLATYIEFVGEQVAERGLAKSETYVPYDKMQFGKYKFRPAEYSFEIDRFRKPKNNLKHSIALASTPVTQGQWVDIMGENPSENTDGGDSIIVKINDKEVWLQPEHPVTNVSIWSMMEFANRMSIRDGLEPAYRLNYERLLGRAEDGSLAAKREYEKDRTFMPRKIFAKVPIRKFVRANHVFFDIHNTRGYRLPSYSEWMFIATNGGDVEHPSNLVTTSNSWVSFAAEGGVFGTASHIAIDVIREATSEVGALDENFTTIDGQKIYDIFGNVQTAVTGNILTTSEYSFWNLGWSYSTMIKAIADRGASSFRHDFTRYPKSSYVGFRLVRTLSRKEAKQ